MDYTALYIIIVSPLIIVAFGELFFFLNYLDKSYPCIQEWLREESIFAYSRLPGVKPHNLINDYRLMFKNSEKFIIKYPHLAYEYQSLIKVRRYVLRKRFIIIYDCICLALVCWFFNRF